MLDSNHNYYFYLLHIVNKKIIVLFLYNNPLI